MVNVENFTIRLGGKLYRVWVDHSMFGFYIPPMCPEGTIVVGCNADCKRRSKVEMRTLVHETLHSSGLGEKQAEDLSKPLAEILWKVGFRRLSFPLKKRRKKTKKRKKSK